MHRLLALTLLMMLCTPAAAQVDEARGAIERGDYQRAVEILSAAMTQRPTADTYVYLGIAYSHLREFDRSQEVFREGMARYPADPRFHNELAGLHLLNREIEEAKNELLKSLKLDPQNSYATDLLASIHLTEGDTEMALEVWNRLHRPVLDNVFHNYFSVDDFGVIRRARTFGPGDALKYEDWKTTEIRLLESGGFSNVGLEIEPAPAPDRYNAIIRTADKGNGRDSFGLGIIKGIPIRTTYFDLWNLGGGSIHWNSLYRWDTDRRRAEGRLMFALPVPGLVTMEVGGRWRSERWDLSPSIRGAFRPNARFTHRSADAFWNFKVVPHYRVSFRGGLEYRNRSANGAIPALAMDGRDTGRFHLGLQIRTVDGRLKNQIAVEGFAARKTIVGDFNYAGGTIEIRNRFVLEKTRETFLDFGLKAGTANGRLPVEDYFVLGMDLHPKNLMRGHVAADHGRYGRGPMGTDFVQINVDLERRFAAIFTGNTANLPYFKIKWELFTDVAKTFDEFRIFREPRWLVDTGAGLKFEAPTFAFNLVYGRDLRGGRGVLFGYVEKRLW